jgi:hypothetical protein
MRLGIENKIVRAYFVRFAKYEVEVLECFCQPETFHTVVLVDRRLQDVSDRSVYKCCSCMRALNLSGFILVSVDRMVFS